jgi:hypothetical protein
VPGSVRPAQCDPFVARSGDQSIGSLLREPRLPQWHLITVPSRPRAVKFRTTTATYQARTSLPRGAARCRFDVVRRLAVKSPGLPLVAQGSLSLFSFRTSSDLGETDVGGLVGTLRVCRYAISSLESMRWTPRRRNGGKGEAGFTNRAGTMATISPRSMRLANTYFPGPCGLSATRPRSREPSLTNIVRLTAPDRDACSGAIGMSRV